jgi:hypothetical protein
MRGSVNNRYNDRENPLSVHLIISGLPQDIRSEQVLALFREFGQVLFVTPAPATNQSYMIQMESHHDALRAMMDLNTREDAKGQRTCRVEMVWQEKTALWFGNLPIPGPVEEKEEQSQNLTQNLTPEEHDLVGRYLRHLVEVELGIPVVAVFVSRNRHPWGVVYLARDQPESRVLALNNTHPSLNSTSDLLDETEKLQLKLTNPLKVNLWSCRVSRRRVSTRRW